MVSNSKCNSDSVVGLSSHAQITENLAREHHGGFGDGFVGRSIDILSFITHFMSTHRIIEEKIYLYNNITDCRPYIPALVNLKY